jgi:ABC-type dipeptide/oligopeptide/nickel transport system permease subunit
LSEEAMLAEASVCAATPVWGLMLPGRRRGIRLDGTLDRVFTGLAIAPTVFGFGLFGDTLRGALDPKLRDR